MKQFLGLVLGAGLGSISAFYLLVWGYDVGAVIGVISHPAIVALVAGSIGAFIGLAVTVGFGRGVGRDQDWRTRIVVGWLGGAASGAMYGAAATTLALGASMVTLGFVLNDERSSMFAGALGGFIIGTMMGALIGFVLGGLIGCVVGAFVGAMPEPALPAKPDLVFAEETEEEKKLSGTTRSRTSSAGQLEARQSARILRSLGKRRSK